MYICTIMKRLNRKYRWLIKRWGNTLANVVALLLLLYLGMRLLWILLQVTTFTSFRVPTTSMNPTLITGDRILVNKWLMGGRIFNLIDAIEHKPIQIRRLPGYAGLKRNDIFVFNNPYAVKADSIGMDVMKYFVKRCIALPGDTLSIVNGYFKISGVSDTLGYYKGQRELSRTPETMRGIDWKSFPQDSSLGWTIKNMGPLLVPATGIQIDLDSCTLPLYKNLIAWEQHKPIKVNNGKVMLGDSVVSQYIFIENYYFAAGDNVLYSNDSRYWGLVPESYVVGKATHIWNSISKETGKIRWKRILKRIS